MLSLIFVLYLISKTLQGNSRSLHILPRDGDWDSQLFRTTSDIVWSCFVTILACIWTSAHPNIPAPSDAGWTRLKRRIIMMIYALIAPEMMVFWAWRQYEGATRIANDYNEFMSPTSTDTPPAEKPMFRRVYDWVVSCASKSIQSTKEWCGLLPKSAERRTRDAPWSQSHGFFVQMGGFVLHERGVPTQVLDYPRFKKLLKSKAIDAPLITESDIQNYSAGDGLSKGLVVFQTTWFVIECISRIAIDLPLCELEIVTLGFAVLNAILYAINWNKPQDVDDCICIPLKDTNAVAQISQDLIDMVQGLIDMVEEKEATTPDPPFIGEGTHPEMTATQSASQVAASRRPSEDSLTSPDASTDDVHFQTAGFQSQDSQFFDPIVTQQARPLVRPSSGVQHSSVLDIQPTYFQQHEYVGWTYDHGFRDPSPQHPTVSQYPDGITAFAKNDYKRQSSQRGLGWVDQDQPYISQLVTSRHNVSHNDCVRACEIGQDYPSLPSSSSSGFGHRSQVSALSARKETLESTKQELLELLHPFFPSNNDPTKPEHVPGWLTTQLRKDHKNLPTWRRALVFTIRCVQFFLRPLGKMADLDTVAVGALRVPMFYAYSESNPQNDKQTEPHPDALSEEETTHLERFPLITGASPTEQHKVKDFMKLFLQAAKQTKAQAASQVGSQAYIASCVTGVVFGAVHLLAWSATFTTAIERTLWRVSVVVIIAVPAVVVIGWLPFRYLGIFHKQELVKKHLPGTSKLVKFIQVGIPAVLGVPLYIVARFTLLTLALISLRDLVPDVHTDLPWNSFIPHF